MRGRSRNGNRQDYQGEGAQGIITIQDVPADSETDQNCRYDDISCDGCRYQCLESYGLLERTCGYYNQYYDECNGEYCDLPRCDGGLSSPSYWCGSEPDLTNDPCGDSCIGMCGNDCNCWPWVCGDCAYHFGCDVHDQACKSCHESWGLLVSDCFICYTPLALVVAEFGC